MNTQATAADQAAHQNGLAAARDAFLADDKTLTIYKASTARKKRVYGNLDDRLQRAIEAYAQRQA